MSRIKELALETVIYGGAVVLNPLMNTFILLKLLTTHLDEEQYGIYSYFYALAGILIVVYSLRMETTYFRMVNQYDEKNCFNRAHYLVLLWSSLLSLAMLMISFYLLTFIERAHLGRYVLYFTAILWFDAYSAVPFARLREHNQSLKFSKIKIFNVLLTVFLIVLYLIILPKISAYLPHSVSIYLEPQYYLDGIFIANLIASACIFIYFFIKYQFPASIKDQNLMRKMLSYTIPLVLIGFAGNATQLLDRLIIPFLSSGDISEGMSNNGIYASAAKIAAIMYLFTKAFNYAYDPFVFKSYKKHKKTDQLGRIAGYFAAFSSVLMLSAICFSSLLSLLLGASFQSSMRFVPILLFAYLLMGLYYHFSVWYKLDDKTHIGAIIACIGMMITLIFNYTLLPKMGLMGPAYSMIISYAIISIICIVWGSYYLAVSYPWQKMSFYIISCISLSYTMIYVQSNFQYSLVVNVILLILYLLFVLYLERSIYKRQIKIP